MSFYGVTDVWAYVIGTVAIILLPGPNSLFVLSVASARGIKAGYQGALGIFVGDSILLMCTALGAAGLLRSNPTLFMVVKYAGAGYLTWLGVNLIWASVQKWRSDDARAQPVVQSSGSLAHPFQRALLISLLNPKAILFFLSFFVQFIDPTYATPSVPFLILGSIVMACSAVYLSVLIFAGNRLAQVFHSRKRLSSGLSSAVGSMFVWFGVKLANTSLN